MDLIGLDRSSRSAIPPSSRAASSSASASDARSPPTRPDADGRTLGAVDPINRERLQNEILRLQAEVRKTILFVTHDIDEAIKMGDRIAILKEGGILAQYATPAELLMAPADSFVEDFVGADRALKRLALLRVSRHRPLAGAARLPGQAMAEVRAKLEGAEVSHALVVDSDRRPVGWLSDGDLARDRAQAAVAQEPDPVLDLDDVLRDALSDLLAAETHYAPVVDGRGGSRACSRSRSSPSSSNSPDALGGGRPPPERVA